MSDEAIRDLATPRRYRGRVARRHRKPRTVAPEVLRHMLEALGLPCATRGDLLASRRLLQHKSTVQALPPLITATAGRPIRLDVGANGPIGARLSLEAGGLGGRPALSVRGRLRMPAINVPAIIAC